MTDKALEHGNTARKLTYEEAYEEVWKMYLKASTDLHNSILRERELEKQLAGRTTSKEWIDIKSVLPQTGVKVRCKLSENIGFGITEKVLYRQKNNGHWNDYHNLVTHWQPIEFANLPAASSTIQEGQGEEIEQQIISMIAKERAEHFSREGWTLEHDMQHRYGELAIAAACYAVHHTDAEVKNQHNILSKGWPWEESWWKPKDTIRNLVRAGALIVAEIRREMERTKTFPESQLWEGTAKGGEAQVREILADYHKRISVVDPSEWKGIVDTTVVRLTQLSVQDSKAIADAAWDACWQSSFNNRYGIIDSESVNKDKAEYLSQFK